MVNRILIRIKVVQMLYSYLLTRTNFKMTPMTRTTSRDKKYGYQVYQDLMLLLPALAGRNLTAVDAGKFRPEAKMRKMALLADMAANDEVRQLAHGENRMADFLPLLDQLKDTIAASVAWRDYKKLRQPTPEDEANLWKTLLQTTFVNDPQLMQTYKKNPNFTFTGLDRGIAMTIESINDYVSSMTALSTARTHLRRSLDQAYDLYISLLVLMINITDAQERYLENAKTKHLASAEDKNPNTKFIDNQLIEKLRKNPEIEAWYNDHKPQWVSDPLLLKRLRELIVSSDVYSGYMANPKRSFSADCDFWRELLRSVVFESEPLAEALESESVFWNDDMHIMSTFVLKTIRLMAAAGPDSLTYQRPGATKGEEPVTEYLLPQYKDEEDEKFGDELFMYAVNNQDEYRLMIDKFVNTSSWDADRLAFMDIVIMTVAIAEIIHYPQIPLPVTMNEYIEIANYYSTNRSGQFINGLLRAVTEHLNNEGIINKK